MPFKSFKNESRTNWGRETSMPLSNDELMLGAILRIADAIEKMAINYDTLIRDRDNHKRWYNEECERVGKRDRSIAALRGQVTKLKKKLAK